MGSNVGLFLFKLFCYRWNIEKTVLYTDFFNSTGLLLDFDPIVSVKQEIVNEWLKIPKYLNN